MDYSNLKSGIYLQRGSAIKKLDVADGTSDFLRVLGFGDAVDDDTLADRVWAVSASLSERAQMLNSIPRAWTRGEGDDIDGDLFGVDNDMLARIDKALMIKPSGAFLYKLRNRKDGLVRLVWLNPETIEPEYKGATHEKGVVTFWRHGANGHRQRFDAKDVIWITRPGQQELRPDPAPLEACRLDAQVLYNVAQMEDSFFAGGGLPWTLIMVQAGTPDSERTRLEKRFDRLRNAIRGPRQGKVVGLLGEVKVETLSFAPDQLDLETIRAAHEKAVFAVFGVKQTSIEGNQANYATATSDKQAFAETMTAQAEKIAAVLNADPDVAASGYTLEIRANELPSNQEEERQRANAVAQTVGAIVADPLGFKLAALIHGYDLSEEAREILEQMIADKDAMRDAMPILPTSEPEPDMSEDDDDIKAWAWNDEAAQFRRWYKKRPGADVAGFKANHLTHADKLVIQDEVLRASVQDYP